MAHPFGTFLSVQSFIDIIIGKSSHVLNGKFFKTFFVFLFFQFSL